ncbi:MAG: hypothetical protein R2772_04980 [Chitinophagales bacterium]
MYANLFKRTYYYIGICAFALVGILTLSSNAAQPGIYNSGGTSFNLLYEEDSSSYNKIQMQEELVLVQLYPGFAVVKGNYQMLNTSNEELHLRMGYPVNGIYNSTSSMASDFQIDSLYAFDIKLNGIYLEDSLLDFSSSNYNNLNSNNWHIWELDFKANETALVEVHFIVATNDAKIVQGYNSSRHNAFIYLFESGKTWTKNIEKARLAIQLMGGVQLKDIAGLANSFPLSYNENFKILYGETSHFSPTENDNFIISYLEHEENFDMEEVMKNKENYIQEISKFPLASIDFTEQNQQEFGDPFEAEKSPLSFLASILIYLAILSPFILGFLALLLVFFILRKLLKKNHA